MPNSSQPATNPVDKAPQELLPAALRDGNPLGLWRRVNGELTRDENEPARP